MRRTAFTVTWMGWLLAATTAGAAARPCDDPWRTVPETYTLIKVGRYGVAALDHGGPFDSGIFLGVESGVSPSRFVELGLSVDWFHRRRAADDVIVIDAPYDLPIEGSVDVDGASTDLVPLGAVLRLRFPVGEGRFAPYVEGQLTYDILRLTSHHLTPSSDHPVLMEETDTFYGPGGTLAFGVETRLDERIGLVLEAGGHGSRPAKDLVVDGTPIHGHVVTDGEFARIGVRLGF